MSSNNELSRIVDKTLKEIVSKKMFTPSDEKFDIIRHAYNKFVEESHYSSSINNKSELNQSVDKSKDVVYEDDIIVVILADNRNKCIKYGEPNLCISWKGSNNYYWRYRMGKMRGDGLGMTTYFVINKKK